MIAGGPKDDTPTAPYGRQEVDLYGDRLGPGAMVGMYLVDELVAEGGCGAVYRARHAASGELVAIKVLHRQMTGDDNMVRRFRREALAVQRVSHPGVVAIREVGALHDGRPFCVMEWLDGQDLGFELAQRGRLSPGEILEIAEQVGAALDAAHRSGVVHRDVKAANVMLRRVGERVELTLLDFGIAKWAAPDEHVTITSATMLGTPQVMAPEQIRSEPVDARTDVYAFGILLYRLATGSYPFNGRDLAEIEEQHLTSPPPRPSELAPVPAGFDAVVVRSMQKQPADRYQSMQELMGELRAALAGERAAARTCVGVLVSGDEQADDLLDNASEALRAAGMNVALDLSNAVLAVMPGDSEAERRRAIDCALALCQPGLSISVHAAAVEGDGSGALYQLVHWPAAQRERVVVSGAAAPADRPDDPRITWR